MRYWESFPLEGGLLKKPVSGEGGIEGYSVALWAFAWERTLPP